MEDEFIGKKFGRLTVVSRAANAKHRDKRYYCECVCGGHTTAERKALITGHTKSCGCLSKETATTHGMSRTRVYNTWLGIKNRCLNKCAQNFDNYGARGIKICDRWLKFENFYEDMGDKPDGYSIERLDVNGNYCPENCIWASPKTQANNRRDNHYVNYNGKKMTAFQFSEATGISYPKVLYRLRLGLNTKQILKIYGGDAA